MFHSRSETNQRLTLEDRRQHSFIWMACLPRTQCLDNLVKLHQQFGRICHNLFQVMQVFYLFHFFEFGKVFLSGLVLKPMIYARLTNELAFSLPPMLHWPGTQRSVTSIYFSSLFKEVIHSSTSLDLTRLAEKANRDA